MVHPAARFAVVLTAKALVACFWLGGPLLLVYLIGLPFWVGLVMAALIYVGWRDEPGLGLILRAPLLHKVAQGENLRGYNAAPRSKLRKPGPRSPSPRQ